MWANLTAETGKRVDFFCPLSAEYELSSLQSAPWAV